MGHRPQVIAHYPVLVTGEHRARNVFGADCCGAGGNSEFLFVAAAMEGIRRASCMFALFAIPIESEPIDDTGIIAVYEELGLRRPRIDQAVHFAGQFQYLPLDGAAIVFYVPNYIIDPAGGERILSVVRSKTESGQLVREFHCCATGATYPPSYTLGTGKDQKVTRVLFAGIAP